MDNHVTLDFYCDFPTNVITRWTNSKSPIVNYESRKVSYNNSVITTSEELPQNINGVVVKQYNGTQLIDYKFFGISIVNERNSILTIELNENGVPGYINIGSLCRFKFKGPECGYTGTATTCDHTIRDCSNYFQLTEKMPFSGTNNSL